MCHAISSSLGTKTAWGYMAIYSFFTFFVGQQMQEQGNNAQLTAKERRLPMIYYSGSQPFHVQPILKSKQNCGAPPVLESEWPKGSCFSWGVPLQLSKKWRRLAPSQKPAFLGLQRRGFHLPGKGGGLLASRDSRTPWNNSTAHRLGTFPPFPVLSLLFWFNNVLITLLSPMDSEKRVEMLLSLLLCLQRSYDLTVQSNTQACCRINPHCTHCFTVLVISLLPCSHLCFNHIFGHKL